MYIVHVYNVHLYTNTYTEENVAEHAKISIQCVYMLYAHMHTLHTDIDVNMYSDYFCCNFCCNNKENALEYHTLFTLCEMLTMLHIQYMYRYIVHVV